MSAEGTCFADVESRLPRFHFDIFEDGELHSDDDGAEFATADEACREAQRILPDIAREEIPRDCDHKTYVVLVYDDDGTPIYSATLAYAGLWLLR